MHTENTLINGIKVNYYDGGKVKKGEPEPIPMLLLHGWGCNAAVYSPVIKAVEAAELQEQAQKSARYRVILPELPGFGESAEPPEPWGVSDYADFVIAFCRAVELQPRVIFAHSLGCRIALKLLYEKRLTPEKTVFTGAAGIKPRKTPKQKLNTQIFKAKKLFLKPFPKAVEKMRQRYGSEDYRSASPVMRSTLVKIVNEDLTPLLTEINNEILLIWGENDDSTPVSDGRLMEKLLPDAGLALIKNAGHYAFLEQPDLFAKILNTYLGGSK